MKPALLLAAFSLLAACGADGPPQAPAEATSDTIPAAPLAPNVDPIPLAPLTEA